MKVTSTNRIKKSKRSGYLISIPYTVFMVSVASMSYAQAVGNEDNADLISNSGSGQARAYAIYIVNQLLLQISQRWLTPTVLCIYNPDSATC
jgi:hypothetical protein